MEDLSSDTATKDFFDLFRFQHNAFKSEAPDDQEVVVYYYSPSGETIELVAIWYDQLRDMLILNGSDAAGYPCQTLEQAPGVHLMMKLVPESEAVGGKSVGFRMVENTDQS